jgi:hypothetical protein
MGMCHSMRYNRKLTIAFNGMNTLTTKYHPYDFATKDDVAVWVPRKPWRLSTIVFVQLMMAREKWRGEITHTLFGIRRRVNGAVMYAAEQ